MNLLETTGSIILAFQNQKTKPTEKEIQGIIFLIQKLGGFQSGFEFKWEFGTPQLKIWSPQLSAELAEMQKLGFIKKCGEKQDQLEGTKTLMQDLPPNKRNKALIQAINLLSPLEEDLINILGEFVFWKKWENHKTVAEILTVFGKEQNPVDRLENRLAILKNILQKEPKENATMLAKGLLYLYEEDETHISSTETRWRKFAKKLHKTLQENEKPQGQASEWPVPAGLDEKDQQFFTLLKYPTLPGTHKREFEIRELCRMIYRSFQDPEEFNKPPLTKEALLKKAETVLPGLFRKILTHQDVTLDNATSRWALKGNRYFGTAQEHEITIKGEGNLEILRLRYQKGSETLFDTKMNELALIQFLQHMKFI